MFLALRSCNMPRCGHPHTLMLAPELLLSLFCRPWVAKWYLWHQAKEMFLFFSLKRVATGKRSCCSFAVWVTTWYQWHQVTEMFLALQCCTMCSLHQPSHNGECPLGNVNNSLLTHVDACACRCCCCSCAVWVTIWSLGTRPQRCSWPSGLATYPLST
jgi:hypothetical protein